MQSQLTRQTGRQKIPQPKPWAEQESLSYPLGIIGTLPFSSTPFPNMTFILNHHSKAQAGAPLTPKLSIIF